MNLEYLALFTRVASTHNISQAGKELGLSPAVASAHLNKLEQQLGVRLIHRTTRRVSLTEDGQAFLPHALDVLTSAETARAAVGAGNLSPQGNLRVTAPASFGRMHLMSALPGFMQRYPDLTIELRLSDSIVNLVEGGFDVAIRDAALEDSTMVARKLASDTRLLVASPGYLEQWGEPATPASLSEHRCVTLVGMDTWQFRDRTGNYSVQVNSPLRADNGEAVRDACAAGLGITVSSLWCAYRHLQRGELVPVLQDHSLVSDTAIWAVYPSSRLLAPKVRVFIDYLADYFGDTPYWEQLARQ
ncbi:LysR family transcriptional regulator [Alteromonas sp. ASW11-19]|uniref:LysR family transcriptional regulator n=1 Tax=Alteromonas salexigens TaxID=2982530 RepID=A0ABT2VPF8_9ALTE|nr:LysR family transcriptional regulator [Alteromonas salexigens]MCU7555200.1 LysR family transcriptional regulator [Alteromonas salexigens]